MRYDVVIIGAGLGGLECGVLLSRRGKRVCVLEKEHLVGGCLQAYRRGKHDFDTGFHYVGGLDEGQKLHSLFSDLGLCDLPWHRMNRDCFDRIVIDGEAYDYPMGFDNFEQRMTSYFPHEAQGIRQYVTLLREIAEHIGDTAHSLPLFSISAKQWLEERIADRKLIKVLCGASLKMELSPRLPLYTFAQINSSFIQSAYRLKGSGQQVADRLAELIRHNGGEVRVKAKVENLEENDTHITAAILDNGERIEADIFIADIHPAAAMTLLQDSKLVKRIQRNRFARLDNTYGMLTVSLILKGDGIPYNDRNTYVYDGIDDFWNPEQMAQGNAVLITERYEGTDRCHQIDILTPVIWQEVEQWQDTHVMHRGHDYELWKQRRAQKAISLAQNVLFETKKQGTKNKEQRSEASVNDLIDKIYVSSPLTYRDYTATAQGSAYGIRKDCENIMFTLLSPRTAAPNLLLTGQNLNLHGILGTSMTAQMTVEEVEKMEIEKLRNN